jgi:5'-3' exonuclease
MLLDTASLYFRAFYGVPDTMRAPDGQPVNAVRGLLDFIARLAADRHPARIVAAWDDDWRPAWRVDLVPSYKAHRVADVGAGAEQVPDLLSPQVPIIAAVLPALGVPVVGAPGFEADDVIGTLATVAAGPVEVVTGDRDLFQLVDQSTTVLYTARGVGRHDVVDDAWLVAKYGITGRQYADFATLRGDSSDGLPGVAGIGEKTAAKLVGQYGGIDEISAAARDASSDLRPAIRRALLADEPGLVAAAEVVRVRRDLPLEVPAAQRDDAALQALDQRYGLTGSLRRAREALALLDARVRDDPA